MPIEKPRRHAAGRYYFKDWHMPDPDSEALHDALHTARYNPSELSKEALHRILGAAEAYCHLAAHPAPNRMVVQQLLSVRSAVRQGRREPDVD